MDAVEREQQARQIKRARLRQRLSQEALAEKAKVAANTVSAIEAGKPARPGSLAKVMAALEIEPEAEAMWRSGLSPDVHLVIETLGIWLSEMPESDRPRAVYQLLRHLVAPEGGQVKES